MVILNITPLNSLCQKHTSKQESTQDYVYVVEGGDDREDEEGDGGADDVGDRSGATVHADKFFVLRADVFEKINITHGFDGGGANSGSKERESPNPNFVSAYEKKRNSRGGSNQKAEHEQFSFSDFIGIFTEWEGQNGKWDEHDGEDYANFRPAKSEVRREIYRCVNHHPRVKELKEQTYFVRSAQIFIFKKFFQI